MASIIIYILLTILVSLTAYYTAVVVIMLIGTLKLKRVFISAEQPFVSVLIAARNEEDNIGKCLASLVKPATERGDEFVPPSSEKMLSSEKIRSAAQEAAFPARGEASFQDYPADKYEIVVVNDRSTDNTLNIIKEFQETYPNVICLSIEVDPVNMTGKQNAVNEGLKICKGEIILNTDADCVVGPSWISSMVDNFDEQTGLVMGYPVTHERRQKRRLFEKLQSLDLVYLVNYAAGCVGLGRAVSCIGNNLGFRREVIDDIGGYENLGYTLTEDAALIQAVDKNTQWRIDVARDKDSVIITEPAESLKQLYNQRRRWILGGRDTKTNSMILLHLIFAYHLLLLMLLPVGILFSIFSSKTLLLSLSSCIFVKLSLDAILSWRILRRLGRLDLLKFIVPYEGFLIFYSVLVSVGTMFARGVSWKGQNYPRKV